MNARSKDIAVIPPMSVTERASQALSKAETEAEILALVEQSKPIVAVTDNASREVCHASMMTLKNLRIAIEKRGKEGRAEAVEYSKAVIAIEKELVALVSPEETRLAALRDAFDAEKEREKELKIQAELLRQKALRERIVELHGCPTLTPTSGSALILEHIHDLEAIPLDDSWEEFRDQAEAAKAAGIRRLQDLHSAALNHEAAQKRLAEERAELERQRAEQAERDRIAREAQAKADAETKAERERQVAEARARDQKIFERQAELDRQEAEARARRAADEAALAAQRAEIERERQALIEAQTPKLEPVVEKPLLTLNSDPVVVTPKLDSADNIWWSDDGERYSYESLGDLIDCCELEVGSVVHYATAVYPDPTEWVHAEDIIERLSDAAGDEHGEFAEDYPEISDEAKAELQALLDAWVIKYATPRFFNVVGSKKYTITRDDLGLEPVQGAE